MLRIIYLYGSLEELAGTKTLQLDVQTPLDLMTALRSQVKGFRAWCDEHELCIAQTNDQGEATSLTVDDFKLSFGTAKEIHLVPKTEGSGIEVAAWVLAQGGSMLLAAAAYVAVNLAIAYVVGSVARALAPSPDTSTNEGVAERPSFIYNGPVNVVEQGGAVPIVYGTHMVGSTVISSGVTVEDIPYVPTDATPAGQPSNPPSESYQWAATTIF